MNNGREPRGVSREAAPGVSDVVLTHSILAHAASCQHLNTEKFHVEFEISSSLENFGTSDNIGVTVGQR